MDNRKQILEYLKSQRLMFLASHSKDQWVAIVFYAIDDNFNIYFISDPKTEHSKNISVNKEIACGISDSRQTVIDKKMGVQFKGVAGEIKNESEIKYALSLWNRSNPGFEAIINFDNLKNINSRVYRVKPRSIKFFNEELYGQEGFRKLKIEN